MTSFAYRGGVASCLAAAALAWLGGCAGNGAGLNANGQPVGSGTGSSGGSGAVTADFASIQQNVFTPICSPCHSGATAPEGLMLDAAHSYDLLVGVPSTEDPSLERIKAGDPDSSYLILKIQGSAGIIGSQMPLHESPLPQATITAIRQWVTDGAPPSSGSSMAAAHEQVSTLRVVDNSPADGAVTGTPVRTIVVAFNHELDASLVNYTNLVIERIEGEPVQVPAYTALADANPSVALVTPAAPLVPGVYRVTVRGTGGGALADIAARGLGADYSFTFTVDASP